MYNWSEHPAPRMGSLPRLLEYAIFRLFEGRFQVKLPEKPYVACGFTWLASHAGDRQQINLIDGVQGSDVKNF